MSTIRILIYTLDKYILQTRTVSFPDHENLVEEVDSVSGQTCIFYECQYKEPLHGTLSMSKLWYDIKVSLVQFAGEKSEKKEKKNIRKTKKS